MRPASICAAALLSSLALSNAFAQCQYQWYNPHPASLSPGGWIYDLAYFDDGNGPALYANMPAGDRIVKRFTGAGWVPMGPAVQGGTSLANWNGNLFIGGSFSSIDGVNMNSLGRWNGTAWVRVGSGVLNNGVNGQVRSLASGADSNGSGLYVGGTFNLAGTTSASNIAKWDGAAWSALGAGTTGEVVKTLTWDTGSGPTIVALGSFNNAGGLLSPGAARWSGTSWSALPLATGVRTGAIYDSGAGPELYAGGDFVTAGGTTFNYIARWNGAGWSPLGSGLNGRVYKMGVFDNGDAPELVVYGLFTGTAGAPMDSVATWSLAGWQNVPAGARGPSSLLVPYNTGAGVRLLVNNTTTVSSFNGATYQQLGGAFNGEIKGLAQLSSDVDTVYAVGAFNQVGAVTARNVAKYTGGAWTSHGNGFNATPQGILTFNDGTGQALYVYGSFTNANGVPANGIASFDGTAWDTLGGGCNGAVRATVAFNFGAGDVLVAGGRFTAAGVPDALRVATWNGSSWQQLGAGFSGEVTGLAVFDAGNGPELYAAGSFVASGGTLANNIAKWTSTGWAPLGAGLSGPVRSLCAVSSGPMAGLYASGTFINAGGAPASRIAKWDGSAWSPLGAGLGAEAVSLVFGDVGQGPSLYAGGTFTTAGGSPAARIARWDGAAWSTLSTGLPSGTLNQLLISSVGGPSLYACGQFTFIGGNSASRLARWNGTAWSAVGSGTDGPITSIVDYDPDGAGPLPLSLWIKGDFTVPGKGITSWDGTSFTTPVTNWTGSSGGMMSTVAIGAGNPKLYVGSSINDPLLSVGVSDVQGIAKWNGSKWIQGVPGISAVTLAQTCDDGSGPALYLAGYAPATGDGRIRKWNGVSLTNMSSGMVLDGPPSCFEVFDADGPGGSAPVLYAGGDPAYVPGGIMRWSGTTWQTIGGGVQGKISSMESFDADGAGSMAPVLLLAGEIAQVNASGSSPMFVDRIIGWDGSNWAPMSGTSANVHRILQADLGSGPRVYVSTTQNGSMDVQTLGNVARWNGQRWTPMGSVNAQARSFLQGTEAGRPVLYVGGEFNSVSAPSGGFTSLGFVKWTKHGPSPSISQQPAPESVIEGEVAIFEVEVMPDSEPFSYQWRVNGAPLTESPIYIGTTTATLVISGAALTDQGDYDCVVTNDCGTAVSAQAALVVESRCGSSDYNGDGDYGTDADIEAFFACLSGNCCEFCWHGQSDFNGDGDYGTDADIEAFFRVLGGGPC